MIIQYFRFIETEHDYDLGYGSLQMLSFRLKLGRNAGHMICFILLWLPSTIVIAYDFQRMSVIEHFEDSTGKLTIQDVQKFPFGSNFRSLHGIKSINFGFTSSAHWFRFQLKTPSLPRESLVLIFGYPLIDDLQLYTPTENYEYKVKNNGRSYPFTDRDFKVKDIAFLIPLEDQHDGVNFYIRARTFSSAQYPINIMALPDYMMISQKSSRAINMYLGSMVVMIFYNLTFLLLTGQIVYFIYVLFICGSCLLVLSTMGVSYEILWPQAVTFNRVSLPFFAAFSCAMMCIFTRVSLKKVQEYHWMRIALWLNILSSSLLMVACFFVSYEVAAKWGILQIFVSSISLFCCYIFLCRKRYRPAYFYLMSMGSLAVASIIFCLKVFDLVPHNIFTEFSQLIGSSVQISLLTFALADQMRELKRQHEIMQRRMIEIQEDHIKALDCEVEAKTQDIRTILQTINQGIFTVSGTPPRIDKEYSYQLSIMFSNQDLKGQDPVALIFTHSDLSGDDREKLVSALNFSLGGNLLSFECNASCFPNSIKIKWPDQSVRILDIEWKPVVGSNGEIYKILVSIRDITLLRQLEDDQQKNHDEFEIVKQIMNVPHDRLARFMKGLHHLLNQSLEIIQITEKPSSAIMSKIFAYLHTIKGNARTYGFTKIVEKTHNIESLIKGVEHDFYTRHFRNTIFLSLKELQDIIFQVEHIGEKKLGRSLSKRSSTVNTSDIDRILQTVCQMEILNLPRHAGEKLTEIKNELLSLTHETFGEALHDVFLSLEKLAKETRKLPPRITVRSRKNFYVPENRRDYITGIFTHLLINALDHGIETPEERTSCHKNPQGAITIDIEESDSEHILIRIQDDGRGLNLPRIRQNGIDKNLINQHEKNPRNIAGLIFYTGLSTSENVSYISGRGVGMHAVLQSIESLGGQIKVEFSSDSIDINRFAQFYFVITLPKNALHADQIR